MTLTQLSDQTVSSESNPLSIWRAKFHKSVDVRENVKLYYGKYGHVVTITRPSDYRDQSAHQKWRKIMHDLRLLLEQHKVDHVSRMEWSTLRIFTNDLDSVIKVLPANIKRRELESVGIMRDEIRASYADKPETYRSVYTVVKKLPWNQYRHKVYYVSDARQKRAIGREALSAIAQQISSTPGVLWTAKHKHNCDNLNHNWKATYFYSTDLDWMPMVMLINPRFIKKIEHIRLESEIE